MIKDILKEANRYEDIRNILNNIIETLDDDMTYPVDAHIDDREIKWKVDGQLLIKEASNLLYLIDTENINCNNSSDDFLNLLQYVRTKGDRLLHNYAIDISHRSTPCTDMNEIRKWKILENLIHNIGGELWIIPDGWKKNLNDKYNLQFIKEDSYVCPHCGCIIEREKLPSPPLFKDALIKRDEIKCPNCDNSGMSYMASYGLCNK